MFKDFCKKLHTFFELNLCIDLTLFVDEFRHPQYHMAGPWLYGSTAGPVGQLPRRFHLVFSIQNDDKDMQRTSVGPLKRSVLQRCRFKLSTNVETLDKTKEKQHL